MVLNPSSPAPGPKSQAPDQALLRAGKEQTPNRPFSQLCNTGMRLAPAWEISSWELTNREASQGESMTLQPHLLLPHLTSSGTGWGCSRVVVLTADPAHLCCHLPRRKLSPRQAKDVTCLRSFRFGSRSFPGEPTSKTLKVILRLL